MNSKFICDFYFPRQQFLRPVVVLRQVTIVSEGYVGVDDLGSHLQRVYDSASDLQIFPRLLERLYRGIW